MTFIPNERSAALDGEQAELDSVDLDIILDGFRQRGVVSGCEVTAGGGMNSAVAAGVIVFDGTTVAFAGGSVAHAAAGSHDRFDLVAIDSAGVLSIIDGTSAYTVLNGPEEPTYTDKVIVASVMVKTTTTTIATDNIYTRRVVISSPGHNSLGGLTTGDAHTQYALLAGRATGQTLFGGVATGEKLNLRSNTAVDGSITFEDANFNVAILASNPVFQQDSGDFSTYSRASNLYAWYVANTPFMTAAPAGLLHLGYQCIGSLTAPNNTTAGDGTFGRISIGNVAIGATASTIFDLSGTITPDANNRQLVNLAALLLSNATAPGATDNVAFRFTMQVQPTAASTQRHIGMKYTVTHDVGAFNITSGTALLGIQGQATQGVAGSTVNNVGASRFSVNAAAGTITQARVLDVQAGLSGDAGIITTLNFIDITHPVIASGGIATLRGLNVNNLAGSGVTDAIGIDIAKQTGNSGISVGLRNAGTNVWTPTAHAQITSASTTLAITAAIMTLTADASYTLTGAGGVGPTIADGQNGQIVRIVNVDTTDTITFQDQGTLAASNLRLSAATVALPPRAYIDLLFLTAVGDWVQVGYGVNL